jgi:hypothetical protein
MPVRSSHGAAKRQKELNRQRKAQEKLARRQARRKARNEEEGQPEPQDEVPAGSESDLPPKTED